MVNDPLAVQRRDSTELLGDHVPRDSFIVFQKDLLDRERLAQGMGYFFFEFHNATPRSMTRWAALSKSFAFFFRAFPLIP